MNDDSISTANWYQAMTLAERAAARNVPDQGPDLDAEVDFDLAERRIQHWRAQPPFDMKSYFAERLAFAGVSEDELHRLFGESVTSTCRRFAETPAWLLKLTDAFTRYPMTTPPASLPPKVNDDTMSGFLVMLEPLMKWGRTNLQTGIRAIAEAHAELPFDPELVGDILSPGLAQDLLSTVHRTLVLELRVAGLQGSLEGNSPADRFQSYIQSLAYDHRAMAILQEYPVLARQVVTAIERWVTISLEFLGRLACDWNQIQEVYCQKQTPGLLVSVDTGAGDTHRGGRSVVIARFGSGFSIVYKPRSFALDEHFQEFLAWTHEHGGPEFRMLKILNRVDYGWVEFVIAEGCHSEEEISRFYERQGGYLALLYAIQATDFHHENLIAAGEHPVLLDLEALFHTRLNSNIADEPISKMLNYSVLTVGLLPNPNGRGQHSEEMDLSGLGGAAGQFTPFPVPSLDNRDTDEIRIVRKRRPVLVAQNRPSLDGVEPDLLAHTGDIVAGFTRVYKLLMTYREQLLAADGPIARFADDEVRVILRATHTYAALLYESFHPDVLRNALDRDRLLDRLWSRVPYLPYLSKVVSAEREDLQKGDIPIFTTRPGKCDLWTSADECIAGFFAEASLTMVRRRIQEFGEQDLSRQLWLIRAALGTLSPDVEQPPDAIRPQAWSEFPAPRAALLDASRAVGDRLIALALRGERSVSWLGLEPKGRNGWALTALNTDLYSGLPGLALFLAYLGSVTGEESYTALAKETLDSVRHQLANDAIKQPAIGAFYGLGGIIYTLAHLAALWDQPGLLVEAEEVVAQLPSLIEHDEHLDLLLGSAGCIGSLAALYRCTPSSNALAAAIQCGEHLLAHARPMVKGIGWLVPDSGSQPLTGFSHGAAGIAWALFELARLTGQERFRAAACAAIDYEQSLFSLEAGNWLDLRTLPGPKGADGPRFVTGWCHGAPGIGLARLGSLKQLDGPETRAAIHTALATTQAHGFGHNHSLCHGDLGNVELFLQAGQILEDPYWRIQAYRAATVVITNVGRNGWRSGTPLEVETPGLMTGLAGIGYELLRLAEPGRVPSVLMLESPVCHARMG